MVTTSFPICTVLNVASLTGNFCFFFSLTCLLEAQNSSVLFHPMWQWFDFYPCSTQTLTAMLSWTWLLGYHQSATRKMQSDDAFRHPLPCRHRPDRKWLGWYLFYQIKLERLTIATAALVPDYFWVFTCALTFPNAKITEFWQWWVPVQMPGC